MYYGHLLTKYEAYLRQLYRYRKGEDIPKPISGVDKASDGLRWVISKFRDLEALYTTHDPRRKEFKDIYYKLFTDKHENTRNEVSHGAPEVPVDQLPGYIDDVVTMYIYAMVISLKEIYRAMESRTELTPHTFGECVSYGMVAEDN
jgi:hypothetical protein